MNEDPLAPLLAHFSVRATAFYTGTLCRPVRFAAKNEGYLHLLRGGQAAFTEGRRQGDTVTAPSLLFFPRPAEHWIRPTLPLGADLTCATVSFENAEFNPIVLALPARVEYVLADLPEAFALLDLLFQEAFAQRAGRMEMLNRLFELVLIHLLRRAMNQPADSVGLLRGIAHPQLCKTLSAVHTTPEAPWSLERMSARAGMSRAAFASSFKRELGISPMEYVTRWRIAVAQSLLRNGEPPKLVAGRVGYQSQAGFLRAFQSIVKMYPKAWLQKSWQAADRPE